MWIKCLVADWSKQKREKRLEKINKLEKELVAGNLIQTRLDGEETRRVYQ